MNAQVSRLRSGKHMANWREPGLADKEKAAREVSTDDSDEIVANLAHLTDKEGEERV